MPMDLKEPLSLEGKCSVQKNLKNHRTNENPVRIAVSPAPIVKRLHRRFDSHTDHQHCSASSQRPWCIFSILKMPLPPSWILHLPRSRSNSGRPAVLPATMSPPAIPLLRISILLASLALGAWSACYFPNGTDVTEYRSQNEAYAPCQKSAEASMCCRINVDKGDHCRSDGLCDSPDHELIWRESCSDPTWASPHCQKLCLNYTGKDTRESLGHLVERMEA